jgi:hypothetical protein
MKTTNKKMKKSEEPERTFMDSFWERTYNLLCWGLIFAFCYMSLGAITSQNTSWDFRVYMAGVNAFNQNKDPYLIENTKDIVGDILPFVYAPHTLIFFEIFFLLHDIKLFYLSLMGLILLGTYFILNLDKKPESLFLVTLVLTGFISAYWGLLTGNLSGFLFLCLFAISISLLMQRKHYLSAIVIGIMSSLSLFPLMFSLVFLSVKQPLIERLKLIGISCGTVITTLGISYLWNPQLMLSFIHSLTSSTFATPDTGGMSTPTPFLMFGYIAHWFYLNDMVITAIISIVYICIVIWAVQYFIRENPGDILKTYSFTALSLFMLLPRTKPYYFIMLAIPLYILAKEYDYKIKIPILLISSLIPAIVYINYWINPHLIPDIVNLYAQSISLLITFGFIIIYDTHRRHLIEKQEQSNIRSN